MALHEEPPQDFFSIGDVQQPGGASAGQVHTVGGQRALEGGPMTTRSHDHSCPARPETSGHIGAHPGQQLGVAPVELDHVVPGTRFD